MAGNHYARDLFQFFLPERVTAVVHLFVFSCSMPVILLHTHLEKRRGSTTLMFFYSKKISNYTQIKPLEPLLNG
jgi:hypothetical protein